MNNKNKNNKNKNTKNNLNNCYTCKPRGTIKDHIINQTENYTFNHDLFNREYIIITSKIHYHDIYDIPDLIKLKLFEDINSFVNFWNLNNNYQIIINNGDLQTHHHFHCKLKIDSVILNRMKRDHFTRINLEKSYLTNNNNIQ